MGSFVVASGSSNPTHQIVDLFELRLHHHDDSDAAAAAGTGINKQLMLLINGLRERWSRCLPHSPKVTCQVHGTHLHARVWLDSEGKPRVEQLTHVPLSVPSSVGCNTVVKWKRSGLHSSVMALVHAGLCAKSANEIRHDYYVVEGDAASRTAYMQIPGGDGDQRFALSRHQLVHRQQQQLKSLSTDEEKGSQHP